MVLKKMIKFLGIFSFLTTSLLCSEIFLSESAAAKILNFKFNKNIPSLKRKMVDQVEPGELGVFDVSYNSDDYDDEQEEEQKYFDMKKSRLNEDDDFKDFGKLDDVFAEIKNLPDADLILIPYSIFEQGDKTIIESESYTDISTSDSLDIEAFNVDSNIESELDTCFMNFNPNPSYPCFRPSVNTSTFLYHDIKFSPEKIDYIRNDSRKSS